MNTVHYNKTQKRRKKNDGGKEIFVISFQREEDLLDRTRETICNGDNFDEFITLS